VSPLVEGWLLLVTVMLLARVLLADTYLLYVKAGMRPWLLASAVVLLLLAAPRYWQALRGRAGPDRPPGGGHPAAGDDHPGRPPRAAWLLILPFFAIIMAAPAPLGAHAANRQPAAQPAAPPADDDQSTTLQPGPDGVVDLTVLDFVWRAGSDERAALTGVPVRLLGMVVPERGRSDGFLLTRFMLRCCAADAVPLQVAVRGLPGPPPAADTWVEVVGVWKPDPLQPDGVDSRPPELTARQVRRAARPADPYEG
jgi:uncharacterized repeat protein (TIGR03943 family)